MIFSNKAKAENEKLKKELAALNAKLKDLNAKYDATKAENEKQKKELESFFEKEKQLKTRLLKEEQENRELKDKNAHLTQKYGNFTNIDQANAFSENLEKQAVIRYNAELKNLATYITRWQNALPEPGERTAATKKRAALSAAIYNILIEIKEVSSAEEGKAAVKRINDVIGGNTGDSSFNLDEVLNPGKLDLESLCKELGVMD